MIVDCRLRDALRRELEDQGVRSLGKVEYIHTDHRPSVQSCGNPPSHTTWNKALGRAWIRARSTIRRTLISAKGPVVLEEPQQERNTRYASHRNCFQYNITLQFLARELGELNRAIDYRSKKG